MSCEHRPGGTIVDLDESDPDTMTAAESDDGPTALAPESMPNTIVGRNEERNAFLEVLSSRGAQHLYVYGQRGSGKTLLARWGLDELSTETATCYVPCTTYDTQYKVLQRVCHILTGTQIASGYHTAQLQHRLESILPDRPVVIVLDEVDFLLHNDGNDLLYYLSRLDHTAPVNLVLISATHPDSSTVIDNRVLSSLQPWYLTVAQYPAEQIDQILATRLQEAGLLERVDRQAVTLIAATTRNVRLGLHWLTEAVAASADGKPITEECVRTVQSAGLQRYRQDMLDSFSTHHRVGFEAIRSLISETTSEVQTGTVYDQYDALCERRDCEPVSLRQFGRFLTDLDLLGLITVDYSYGGAEGKTRTIQLQQI